MLPLSLEEAYRYCERLARSHYENFHVGSRLLPRSMRKHVWAIYAFCRITDDLGDEAEGNRLASLDAWERDLLRCYESSPRELSLLALQDTIRRFAIPKEPFIKLIEANRIDQRVNCHQTFEELLYYCDHSANPVGHMFLYVFGYSDAERQKLSDKTCTALQLTNFWQDIAIDLKRDRIYIPLEDLQTFHYTEADLRKGIVDDRFQALMKFEVDRTRSLFLEGLDLLAIIDGRMKVDVRLFSLGGLKILEGVEACGYDIFRYRPALSAYQRAKLLFWGLVRPGAILERSVG